MGFAPAPYAGYTLPFTTVLFTSHFPCSPLLRVSLTGPESTGKSTLAAQLAAHYGTVFAPEFAREYLAESGPHYAAEDLE